MGKKLPVSLCTLFEVIALGSDVAGRVNVSEGDIISVNVAAIDSFGPESVFGAVHCEYVYYVWDRAELEKTHKV